MQDQHPSRLSGLDLLVDVGRQLQASVPGSSSGIFDDKRVAQQLVPIPAPSRAPARLVLPVRSQIIRPAESRVEYLGAYLTLKEWVGVVVAARGVQVPDGMWVEHLVRQHPRDDMLAAIATVGRAVGAGKMQEFVDVVRGTCTIDLLPALDAAMARQAPRPFVCRQGLLLATKEVLRANVSANAATASIPPLLAAVLLSQAVLDDVESHELEESGVELFPGMDARLAITVVSNWLFQATSEAVTTLDLSRRLWIDHGPRSGAALGRSPRDALHDAIGLDLTSLMELGLLIWASVDRMKNMETPYLHHWSTFPFDPEFLERALSFISASPERMIEEMDTGGGGAWDVLVFETHPVVLLDGRPPLVLDELLLWRRFANGPFYGVLDDLRVKRGPQASRAWTSAYGDMVERMAQETLPAFALPLPPAGTTYWDGEAVKAAFGRGKKSADGVFLFGTGAVVTEIVSSGPTVASRILGDHAAFATVMERQLWDKVVQMDATAADLLDDDRRLTGWPNRVTRQVRPLLIQGRAFPFMPVVHAYVTAECQRRNLLQRPGIKPLLVVEIDELEMLLAVAQATSRTLEELLDAWDAGPRRAWPAKNHLLAEHGDLEARLRPAAVTDSIVASFDELERRLRPPSLPESGMSTSAA